MAVVAARSELGNYRRNGMRRSEKMGEKLFRESFYGTHSDSGNGGYLFESITCYVMPC